MKLTIEDVQVAIKGVTKYGNRCISEQLLAVVAGNYAKGNNIILLRLQSLYEDEYSDFTVGEIKNLYYTEKTGKAQLRGDLIFDTEKLDIQSILHSLAHGCVYLSPYFMNVASLNYGFACLSQVTLSKAEDTDFDGIEPLDISCLDGLINALYKEPTPKSDNKIHFNESDTLEIEKGYLIVNTKDTVSAVKISEIEVIESIKNKDKTETVFMRTASGTCEEMRRSNISTRDLIEILEQYKESQLVALKAS
ncbi:TPA: hypothetical protein G8V49_003531 [Salmonella enterica]|uniref:Uncharacterized protein n=1 Tax=Salmonella enterica TaxID=28901 RepID=A0A759WG38_SALER|nr:hypothetical protein [Salmonella enterica]EBI1923601.1 hypothetical protein [Salmonella enterica]HAG2211237.1 hypothetical protein [Salmonella enterica]